MVPPVDNASNIEGTLDENGNFRPLTTWEKVQNKISDVIVFVFNFDDGGIAGRLVSTLCPPVAARVNNAVRAIEQFIGRHPGTYQHQE